MTVAVLFTQERSVYNDIPGLEVYDIKRDARTYQGPYPIVGHPPCRAWGRLRQFANPRPDEKELATWCVDQIRIYGGVLEHPSSSSLWDAKNLPKPGCGKDEFGGWSLDINQNWWGHKATKRTWLYIVGCEPAEIPTIPLVLGEGTHIITSSKRFDKDGKRVKHHKKELSKKAREATPPAFADWLIELAKICGRNCGIVQ